MPWAIKQSGNAGYLQLSSQLVFASTDDWKFEFATLAPAGTSLFKVHGLRASTSAQIYIDVSTLKVVILFSPAADRIDFNLPSGFDISVRHDFVLEKSGSVFSLLMDGASLSYVKQGTSTAWGGTSGIAAFFRSGNVTMADGQLFYFKFTKNSVLQNSFINESGTGTSWIDTVSGNNAAQSGTWPADNAEWVFYDAGGDISWTGTISKTALSSVSKQVLLSLGYSSGVNKSPIPPSAKQLNVSAGTILGVGKQLLTLSNKQEAVQLGYINTLSKNEYNLVTKQLSVVSGANLPFTGALNKTSYSLSGKQLSISAGWNSDFDKQTFNVSGKQESTELGFVVDINELNLTISGKPFSIQTGTSISFIGELSKSDLNIVGKPLSVDAGTVIPFIGLLGKTSLSLSGKALSRLHGQILDIQKQSVSLVTKQLSVGEVVYPIIPVERLFTFTDKGRTYLFKQTTNVYLLTNKNNTYLIKGK